MNVCAVLAHCVVRSLAHKLVPQKEYKTIPCEERGGGGGGYF